jgi:thiamine-phosphate pyrophosphorylase
MRARPAAPPLYAIADVQVLGPERLPEAVAEMAAAGVAWIQLRAKRQVDAELWRLAESCARRLEGSGAVLWVNDRADVVALLNSGDYGGRGPQLMSRSGGGRDPHVRSRYLGLHLGQRDLPPAAARPLAGGEVWIGLSTHDLPQVAAAAADPEVDLIAFGPVFATTGKEQADPVVGLERLRQARAATDKPLVAIGGIDAGNIAEVLAAGADSAAVLGAVCRGDLRRNCRELLAAAAVRRGCASS